MIFNNLIRCHHDPALKRRATVIPSRCDGDQRRGIGTGGGDGMASRCDRMQIARRFNAGS